MMDKFPIPPERRRLFEQTIRIIDLVVYVAVCMAGVYAAIGTPNLVLEELAGSEWLIYVWATLLLVGGSVGLLGRLTRYWMVEVPATVVAFTGVLIFLILIAKFSFTSITAAVATTLVLVALAWTVRRWAELQIFASDPDPPDLRSRVAEALRRRTQNFVHRHE